MTNFVKILTSPVPYDIVFTLPLMVFTPKEELLEALFGEIPFQITCRKTYASRNRKVKLSART